MVTVYKYRLEWSPVQIVRLPLKRVLTIQIQDGTPCLWVLVDTDASEKHLTVRMIGTGANDGCDFGRMAYISTTQFGAFVLNWFFERVM